MRKNYKSSTLRRMSIYEKKGDICLKEKKLNISMNLVNFLSYLQLINF